MAKVKFFAGDQEVLMPEKGRGESAFGAIPDHLRREEKPREIKPSPIHDAIVDVLDHEALGGVAHVDDIQAGLIHLHGMSYKQSPLYGHLKNAVKLGRIFKVEAKRGFYSTTPIAAIPHENGVDSEASESADFDEDAGYEAPAPAPQPVVARPVAKPSPRPLGVGRIVR
jgi:hypothetical protein